MRILLVEYPVPPTVHAPALTEQVQEHQPSAARVRNSTTIYLFDHAGFLLQDSIFFTLTVQEQVKGHVAKITFDDRNGETRENAVQRQVTVDPLPCLPVRRQLSPDRLKNVAGRPRRFVCSHK